MKQVPYWGPTNRHYRTRFVHPVCVCVCMCACVLYSQKSKVLRVCAIQKSVASYGFQVFAVSHTVFPVTMFSHCSL